MSGRFPIRTLMFGGLAVAMAGGTMFVGQGLMQSNGTATNAVDIAANEILVAVRPLTVGSAIVVGDLAWRPWPKAGLDPAYVVRGNATLESFTGHIVRSAMFPGEPATLDRLPAPGDRSTLALVTRAGMRAVSVALTPTSGVSGLIMPGDRVDVVLTYVLPRPADGMGGTDRRAATTILIDLRVLAIDQRLTGKQDDTKEIRNASLEVSAKQSETLALAADLGKLSLSLRSTQTTGPDAASEAPGGSTLDYQVGPLLRRSAAPVAVRRARIAQGPPPLSEFHGSKNTSSGSGQ